MALEFFDDAHPLLVLRSLNIALSLNDVAESQLL
jgi:hypothetical protein